MLLLMDVRTMNCLYDRRFILTPLQPNTGNIFFDLRKMSHLSAIKDFFDTIIKPDTPINVYTRFCLNTAKSKFSLVSPVAD